MSIRAGFIGLGNIGEPMAERLVGAGLPTTVFDLRESAMQALASAGANTANSCRELAAGSDVIGICVRDDADVRAVVLGEEGALAGAAPGSVIAIHSTILPSTVQEIGAAAAARSMPASPAVQRAPSRGRSATSWEERRNTWNAVAPRSKAPQSRSFTPVHSGAVPRPSSATT